MSISTSGNMVATTLFQRGERLRGRGEFGRGEHQGEVVTALAIAAIVGLALIAGLVLWRRLRSGRLPPQTVATATTPGHDPAVTQLRVRYANGEIDSEDFLQRLANLSGQPVASTEQ